MKKSLVRILLVFMLVLLVTAMMPAAQADALVYASLGGAHAGADDGGAIMTFDETTGVGTVLGIPFPGRGITGIAFDSNGTLFGVTSDLDGSFNSSLIQIDPISGAMVTNIGDLMLGGSPVTMTDIAVQPGTDILFGMANTKGPLNQNDLVIIDTITANVTFVGPEASSAGGYQAIAFGPDGTLYSSATWNDTLLTLNPANAALLTTTSVTPGNLGALGLGARPSDGLLFFSVCCETTLGNDIYTLDASTGVATFFASAGGSRRVHDLAFITITSSPVPTMNQWGMITFILIAGLGAIYFIRRKRIES